MAHLRDRYLSVLLEQHLRWSPSVSVVGMRQSGKSTLARAHCKSYFTFDDDRLLFAASQGNWSAIESADEPVTLDEIQKLPQAFDRVKLWIDQKRRPGRFILTGSVRFSARRAIQESLTGRTTVLELLPLMLAEAHQRTVSPWLAWLRDEKPSKFIEKLKARAWASALDVHQHLERGGMPGICFLRDPAHRRELWNAHLETVLGRDLDLVYRTRLPLGKLKLLYTLLATHAGVPIEAAPFARQLGCSAPTLVTLLRAYEALFLIRPHGNTYYCEDHGLASFARGDAFEAPRSRMLRFLFHELLGQLSYLHRSQFELSAYRSKGGIDIPFVMRLAKRSRLAITVDDGEGASEKALKSIVWYRKRHPEAIGAVIHAGPKAYLSSSGIPCIPWTHIC